MTGVILSSTAVLSSTIAMVHNLYHVAIVTNGNSAYFRADYSFLGFPYYRLYVGTKERCAQIMLEDLHATVADFDYRTGRCNCYRR